MITVKNLITKEIITSYDMSYSMQDLIHDIECNDYFIVSMVNGCSDITLKQHTEDIDVLVLKKF